MGESISDEFDFSFSQERVNLLKENLIQKSIYSEYLINNYMKSKKSKEKKEISIDKDEVYKNEQIEEVKYNMFFILNNNCDVNNDYDIIIKFPENVFLAKRLLIQKGRVDSNNEIKFNDKDYIFIPLLVKTKTIIFPYKGLNIEVEMSNQKKSCKMLVNKKEIMSEEQFKSNYKYIIDDVTNSQINKSCKNLGNKRMILSNAETDSKKSTKSNTIKQLNINPVSNDGENLNKITFNSEKDISDENKDSKEESLLLKSFSKNDSSDKEIFDGPRFYEKIGDNSFVRYVYTNVFRKEVDGFYCVHNNINLNIKGKIHLEKSLKLLQKSDDNYNNKNDIKANIILKNFEQNYIPENEPIILEIKKDFELIEILKQIKKTSKLLNNVIINENNLKDSMPKYCIGILCNYNNDKINKQMNILNRKYKDSSHSLLEHIMNIIKNNNINIVIGVILNGTINDYSLGKDDYEIDGENNITRVDLNYMNKIIFQSTIDEKKINTINEKFSQRYKSLILQNQIPANEYHKLSRKLKEKDDIINKLIFIYVFFISIIFAILDYYLDK